MGNDVQNIIGRPSAEAQKEDQRDIRLKHPSTVSFMDRSCVKSQRLASEANHGLLSFYIQQGWVHAMFVDRAKDTLAHLRRQF